MSNRSALANPPVLTDDGQPWPEDQQASALGNPPPQDGSGGYWWPQILQGLWNSAKSGATLPGDVATGKAHTSDPNFAGRVVDMTGLVTGAPGAIPAEEGEMRMGAQAARAAKPAMNWDSAAGHWTGGPATGGIDPASLTRQPDVFAFQNMDQVPGVPQTDLPRYTPPRGVSQRVQDITSNPQVRQQMLDIIKGGLDQGPGRTWYNTEELRQNFLDELGPDKGPQAYAKFMDYVAASSPRNPVPTNIKAASYYYWRDQNGQPPLQKGEKPPSGYGSVAQNLHVQNAQDVAGDGWDVMKNPKPASFSQNLQGNQAPGTIDTHAFRLPAMLAQDPRFLETAYASEKGATPQNIAQMVASGQMSMADAAKQGAYWNAKPNANEYGAMEQYYKSLADELGISTAQAQAAAWTGGGRITGLSSDEAQTFLHTFQDRVKHTADRLGQTPQQILSNVIQGRHPLLTSGPGPALSVLGNPPPNQQ